MNKKIAIQTMAAASAFAMAAGSGVTISFAATKPDDQTLTITTDDNKGATYAAYKIATAVDTVGEGESATYTFEIASAFKNFFANGTNGYFLDAYNRIHAGSETGDIVATMGLTYTKASYDKTQEAAKLAAALQKYAEDNSVAAESAAAGTHEAGYYLVVETGSASNQSGHIASKPVLVSLVPNGTHSITPKDDSITFAKHIVDNGQDVKKLTVAVGDTIGYKIDTAVPTYAANVDKARLTYKIEDTLSAGLDFTQNSLVVKAGDTTLVSGTDYTVAFDGTGNRHMIIAFTQDAIVAQQGKAIVATYNAKVNSNAVVDDPDGNPNDAKVTFTNNAGQSQTKDTLPDNSVVYTYALKLKKLDAAGETLSGAKFELKKDGSETVIDTYTTGTDGTAEIKGLDEGAYVLTETEAPTGYAKLTDPIKFTIADENPSDPTGKGVFTVTSSDDVASATFTGLTNGKENGDKVIDATMELKNRKGITLPETGSAAARNLMIAGVAAVAVGGFVMVCSKKKEN